MLEKHIIIGLPSGLQARIAMEFVKRASSFASDVKLIRDVRIVDGKSIIGVMSLALRKGESVTICVNGHDEQKAFHELEGFLLQK